MDQAAAALGSPTIVASPPQAVVDLAQAGDPASATSSQPGRQCGVTPPMEFLGFVDGVKTSPVPWPSPNGSGDPSATVVADVFHMIRGGRHD